MPLINAFKKFPYTGQVYNYTTTSDGQGQPVRSYFFHKEIKMDVVQSTLGRLTFYMTDDGEDVLPRAQVRELKDKDGNELYPGSTWTFLGLLPNMNNFGQRDGYRGQVELTFEGDF